MEWAQSEQYKQDILRYFQSDLKRFFKKPDVLENWTKILHPDFEEFLPEEIKKHSLKELFLIETTPHWELGKSDQEKANEYGLSLQVEKSKVAKKMHHSELPAIIGFPGILICRNRVIHDFDAKYYTNIETFSELWAPENANCYCYNIHEMTFNVGGFHLEFYGNPHRYFSRNDIEDKLSFCTISYGHVSDEALAAIRSRSFK
jgi:hypothetical protein